MIDAKGEVIEEKAYFPFGLQVQELTYKSQIDAKPYEYTFGGKEVWSDLGLGLLDFHARGYDKILGRTLQMDPHLENYFSESPFSFLGNNPVNNIDPTGMDWFQNEKTGNVVYVSSLKKGAEKNMEKGWTHMGENGMFSNGESGRDDSSIIEGSKKLTSSFGTTETYENGESKMTTSASFEGDNAKKFMSKQGYDQKPKEANVHTNTRQQGLPEPHGVMWLTTNNERIEKTHSVTYVPKGTTGTHKVLGYYGKQYSSNRDIWTNTYSRKTWEKRRYNYNTPNRKPGKYNSLILELIKNLKFKK